MCTGNVPFVELETLADQQEGFFSGKKGLPRSRDLWTGGIPWLRKSVNTTPVFFFFGLKTYSERTVKDTPAC